MNTAKERIIKLVEEIPETKAGEIIDYLLFLKSKKEQDLYLTPEEEEKIWDAINKDERMSSDEVEKMLIGENDE